MRGMRSARRRVWGHFRRGPDSDGGRPSPTTARSRQAISHNGLAFTGSRHRRQVLFERNLIVLGVQALTSRPTHPQTHEKLECYHQTFEDWYADQGPAAPS
jgi:hypothetical protein